MQWPRISFPIEIHRCALEFGIQIVWLDSERAVQSRFFLCETAEMTITKGNLLQHEAVAGIQINGALEATYRLCLFPLATLDIPLQLKNSGIVRQSLGGDIQFG